MNRPIPKRCPDCGAEFPQALGSRTPISEKGETGPRGWSCWCPSCNWTGDVFPTRRREER
jgi:hypothetical protein